MSIKGKLLYEDLTWKIIGAAFDVHNALGKGLSEKAYQNALITKLKKLGLSVEQQKSLTVIFEGQKVGEQTVDVLVENRVIIEVKAVDHLVAKHTGQVLRYLKTTKYQLGLVLNFGTQVQFKRFIHTTQQKI